MGRGKAYHLLLLLLTLSAVYYIIKKKLTQIRLRFIMPKKIILHTPTSRKINFCKVFILKRSAFIESEKTKHVVLVIGQN